MKDRFTGGILFLTNNRNALPLYEWLVEHGEKVTLYSGRLSVDMLEHVQPKWVISYNYSYIVSKEIIALLHGHIVNLHASYLPWNRGASPNFWSFVEDTPKGVSIHFMDEGLDTGDLIAQEELVFEEKKRRFVRPMRHSMIGWFNCFVGYGRYFRLEKLSERNSRAKVVFTR